MLIDSELTDQEKREQKATIRQKDRALAMFGPGQVLLNSRSWEKTQKTMKPHRCNGHLDDFLFAAFSWPWFIGSATQFKLLVQCQLSEPGKEPERLVTSPP